MFPKPVFEKRTIERAFYESYFDDAGTSLPLDELLGDEAQTLAERYGLAAMDALQQANVGKVNLATEPFADGTAKKE